MPRSLLARLLAVSLTVAVCAIVATAWLTYRTTSDHLQNQVERVLESDAAVYQELIAYAQVHSTWDDVQPLVAQLSERTGRRIALTTPDGTLLVDSADLRGDEDTALPSAPAALIEVLVAPAVSSTPPTRAAPVPAGEAVQPDQRELALNRAFVEALISCLTRSDVGHRIHDLGGGLRAVEPVDRADAGAYDACDQESRRQAAERATADPALLYLGTAAGRLDPVSAAASGKTIATILAVAAIAVVVTVATGLRLLRPVRALTRAARRMEAGDSSARVTARGHDEIAALGHAFNAMAEAAERQERARQAMVNDVAHELRNPLANIRGHLEAAQDGILPFDRALVDSLLEEARILERLTTDLRDLALADAGRLRIHPREVDLGGIAAHVVNASRARANASGITLVFARSAPTVVRGDPTRLCQALGNLVDNALRYTPPGGTIEVVVATRHDVASVTVVDTGIGIAASDLAHLFDRFYRADPSRSRRTGGSGLGLAITRHLVEAHQGRITVGSEIGRGSTFTVELPLAIAHRVPPRRPGILR
jgi:two-component system sensor histidine kinase BaeS